MQTRFNDFSHRNCDCRKNVLGLLYSEAAQLQQNASMAPANSSLVSAFGTALGSETCKTAGLYRLETEVHLTLQLLTVCNTILENSLACIHRLPDTSSLPASADQHVEEACTSCTAVALIMQRHLAEMQGHPAAFSSTVPPSSGMMPQLHQLCMTAPACLRCVSSTSGC